MMYLLIQNRQHFVRHSLACTAASSGQGTEITEQEQSSRQSLTFLVTRIHCHYPKPMLSEDFSSESLFVGNRDVIYALLYGLDHAHSPFLLQPEQKWH